MSGIHNADPPLKRFRLRGPVGFLLLFLLLFFAIDRLAGVGLGRIAETSRHRFSRVYRGKSNPCIVVLGHSRGVQLLSPDAVKSLTGIPVYNLSANGMSTEIAEALFLDYLDNGGKPAGLVVEVTSVCSNNGLVRDLKMFARRSDRIGAILRKDEPSLAVATSLFHSFRYNGDMMSRMVYHWNRHDQDPTNFYVAKPDFLAATPLQAADWQIKEPNPDALARMVARARADRIPVRLVLAPFWPPAEADAGVSERVIAAVAKVTDERVRDYSESLTENRFFADHVHLNADGTLALHRVMEGDGFFDPWRKANQPNVKQ